MRALCEDSHAPPPPDQTHLPFCSNPIQIDVKVIGLNEKGKVRLSRKAVLMDERGGAAGRPPRRGTTNGTRPAAVPLAGGGALGVVKRTAPAATAKAAAAVLEGGPVGGDGDGDTSSKGG